MTAEPVPKMGKNAALWRQTFYRLSANLFFKRRVGTPDGRFDVFVSPGCQLNVLHPGGVPIDPVHSRFIARWIEPGSVVWDVGGNMGLFAFPAALKARHGQVYTFEPDVQLAYNLVRSLRSRRNRGLPISLMSFALSDLDDVAELLVAAHGKSMNKLAGAGPWHDDLFESSETRSVATLRIEGPTAPFGSAPTGA